MSQPRRAPTNRQLQVLAYMHTFLQVNQQLPPRTKIAADFGWASSNAADTVVVALEKKGALGRNEIGKLMITPEGVALLAEGRK